jgi:P22 coat protein - gene protein 5
MANTLTNLAADIYKAADIVGRELVGFITSSTVNGGAERAAKGDPVRSAFTRAQTVNTTFSPAMTIPEGTDQTVDTKTVALNSYASVQIPWTGEDQKHVNNGIGFETVYGDQIAQAFRTITNKIELDGWNEARKNASRAYGTAGTTPFASAFSELPQLQKILVDNGMPFDGQMSLVMDTTAGAALQSLSTLQKVNEAGTADLLRQGMLGELMGFYLKRSGQISQVTKGTGASYVTSGSTAVGTTDIALVTGTGTVLAGDVVTFAADANNKYVVNTGVAAPGTISLGTPGARVTIATANALTVGNNFTPNVALHKSALELAIRPPAEPAGGDAADDKMIIVDPWSGLAFEIASYKGYMKRMIEVRCLYQWKAWKPDAIALLLG